MAVEVAAITARLEADIRDFDKKMGKAEKRLGDLEGGSKKTSKAMSGMAKAAVALGGVLLAGKFAQGMKAAVGAASDYQESINAVEVATGDASGEILRMGDDAARAMGLSKTAVNEAAVAFSAFGEKIDATDVAGTFEDYIGRATDFASVMNLDVDDALTKFQSGLAGETEALRRFGIDVSANSVKQFALANGIAKTGQEMSEAEKIQARYGLLMQQTDKFAGDFANTSDSLANSQRTLAATWENAQIQIGEGLIPAIEAVIPLLTAMAEGAGNMGSAFALGIKALKQTQSNTTDAERAMFQFEKIQGAVRRKLVDGATAGNVAADAMGALAKANSLTTDTMEAVQKATGATNQTMKQALAFIVDNAEAYALQADQIDDAKASLKTYADLLAGEAVRAEEAFAEGARESAGELMLQVVAVQRADEALRIFIQNTDDVGKLASRFRDLSVEQLASLDIFAIMKLTAAEALQVLRDEWTSVEGRVRAYIQSVKDASDLNRVLGGRGPGVTVGPQRKFHSGGVVPGPRGREVDVRLLGGERVVPLNETNDSSVTINMNGNLTTDGMLQEELTLGLLMAGVSGQAEFSGIADLRG